MRTVGMIPIKMNSERVKGKNIRRFCDGKPLVAFIQEALTASELVDEVYVYCSDEAIRNYLVEGVSFLKRPAFLDGDNANCNDIIREFIKEVDADFYVVCHATAPFTRTESIDRCVRAVTGGEDYDSAFTVERLQTFLWSDEGPVNFDPNNFPRTQDLDPLYLETSGAFVFSKQVFEKYGRRVGVRPCLIEVDPDEGCDIDTEYDMRVAQALYRTKAEGVEKK